MSLKPHQLECAGVNLKYTRISVTRHRLCSKNTVILICSKQNFFPKSMSDTHLTTKLSWDCCWAGKAPVQYKVQVPSGGCVFSINKLAWLQLKNERVLDNIFETIGANFAEKRMVKSYFMKCEACFGVPGRRNLLKFLNEGAYFFVRILLIWGQILRSDDWLVLIHPFFVFGKE